METVLWPEIRLGLGGVCGRGIGRGLRDGECRQRCTSCVKDCTSVRQERHGTLQYGYDITICCSGMLTIWCAFFFLLPLDTMEDMG